MCDKKAMCVKHLKIFLNHFTYQFHLRNNALAVLYYNTPEFWDKQINNKSSYICVPYYM